MEVNDFWDDLKVIFEGQPDEIKEFDLVKLTTGSMAECLRYLLLNAKDCSARFLLKGTETQVYLPSPHTVVNYVLQGQVSAAMWLSFPALSMLSVYIDFDDEISFGYVRGTWTPMDVLAFFDLMYELVQMCPGAELRPGIYSFTQAERQLVKDFWKDYL